MTVSVGARRAMSALAAIVLLALLVVAAREIDGAAMVAALRTTHIGWIVAALVAYATILPLWALQWCRLAPPAPKNRALDMLGVVALASTTHNTAPFLVGEATGAFLLVSRVGLTRAAALSVIAMDQLLVGIAKVVVLTYAALAITLPVWMSQGAKALAVGVGLFSIACLLAAWNHERVGRMAARVASERVAAALGRLAEALAPVRSLDRGGVALMLAFAKKLAEIVAIICVQRAFGISMPFASAVLVLAALNLATMIPLVPANLGVFEGAVVVTYTYLGMSADQALGIAIVQHACYFVALAVPGYAWVFRSRGESPLRAARSHDAA